MESGPNLHVPETLTALVTRLDPNHSPHHLLVSGPSGIGRKYVTRAACRAAQPKLTWRVLDFSAYEPDFESSAPDVLARHIAQGLDSARITDETLRAARFQRIEQVLQWTLDHAENLANIPTLPLELQLIMALTAAQTTDEGLTGFLSTPPPSDRSPGGLLAGYLRSITTAGPVLVHADATELPLDVRTLLVHAMEATPEARLALSTAPQTSEDRLLPGQTRPWARVEIETLTLPQLTAQVARVFEPHHLPDPFLSALWTASQGLPSVAGKLLGKLIDTKALTSTHGGWRLPSKGLDAPSVAAVFEGAVDRSLGQKLSLLPLEDQRRALQFVEFLALGGPTPSQPLLRYLVPPGGSPEDDEDAQERLIDFLDDHLAARLDGTEDGAHPLEGGTPLLRDYQFQHLSFREQRGGVYGVLHPEDAAVVRARLRPDERKGAAQSLLRHIVTPGQLDTGCLAESQLYARLAQHLNDDERRRFAEYAQWTVRPEFETQLDTVLSDVLQDETRSPHDLWTAFLRLEAKWPSFRCGRFLEAYARHSERIPNEVAFDLWDRLMAYRIKTDRYPAALEAAQTLVRIARATPNAPAWYSYWAEIGVGWCQYFLGNAQQAEAMMTKSLPMLLRSGASPGAVAGIHAELGDLLARRDAWADAETHYETALSLWSSLAGVPPDKLSQMEARQGYAKLMQGDPDAGRALIHQADERIETYYSSNHLAHTVHGILLGGPFVFHQGASTPSSPWTLAEVTAFLSTHPRAAAHRTPFGGLLEAKAHLSEARRRFEAVLQVEIGPREKTAPSFTTAHFLAELTQAPPEAGLPISIAHVEAPEGHVDLVICVPPDHTFEQGLIPQAILGQLINPLGPQQPLTPKNFAHNRIFVEFMHNVIALHAPKQPAFIEQAKRRQTGSIYLVDRRTPDLEGQVPAEDIIGVFQVERGEVVPDSYQPNPNHHILSERGFVILGTELQSILVDEILKRT